LLLVQLFNLNTGSIFSGSLKQTILKVSKELNKPAQKVLSTESTERKAKTTVKNTRPLKTYDIGAYITYGGQAYTLNRAAAKLSADRKRLAVGLYEDGQPAGAKPALAIIISFKEAATVCDSKNIRELA